jgi:hypothetical protein
MRGFALNVHTRTLIINAVWALTVIQFGMQAHAEKIMVDTICTQIKNLKENADVYKSIHGEKGYNELLVSLITKMTGSINNKGTTPSSAHSPEDRLEDEDDDNKE